VNVAQWRRHDTSKTQEFIFFFLTTTNPSPPPFIFFFHNFQISQPKTSIINLKPHQNSSQTTNSTSNSPIPKPNSSITTQIHHKFLQNLKNFPKPNSPKTPLNHPKTLTHNKNSTYPPLPTTSKLNNQTHYPKTQQISSSPLTSKPYTKISKTTQKPTKFTNYGEEEDQST
jgi:hypothetical protein